MRHLLQTAAEGSLAAAAESLEVEAGEGGGLEKSTQPLAVDASGASTARDDSTRPSSPHRPGDESRSSSHLQRQSTGPLLEEESWRDTLMRLRALHPNAGNSSGKAQPLDAYASDIGMINRVLQMKEHLRGVEQLHADKFGLVLQAHLAKKSDADGLDDPLLHSEEFHNLNVYASNLKTNLKT